MVLSTRLHEKIAAKPKARFLIEFAPGRYFDFVAEELVRTLKTVEMLNEAERRKTDVVMGGGKKDLSIVERSQIGRAIVLGAVFLGAVLSWLKR